MPDISLDRLEQLAKAATPSPWWTSDEHTMVYGGPDAIYVCEVPGPKANPSVRADLDYLSSVSPEIVLRLITALQACPEIATKIGTQTENDRPNKYFGESAFEAADAIRSMLNEVGIV